MIGSLILPSEALSQRLFMLGQREGFIQFGVAHDSLEAASGGKTDFRSNRMRFDEGLGLRGSAFVVDPRFASLTFGSTLGFFQDRFSANQKGVGIGGRLLTYDFSGNFLSEKNYSSSAYANRSQGRFAQPFGRISDFQTSNQGVNVFLRALPIPSNLSYRTEGFRQTSPSPGLADVREELRRIFSYDGRKSWESQLLNLNYELTHFEDPLSQAAQYSARRVGVSHRLSFDEQASKQLATDVNYFKRSDQQGLSSMTLTERLDFRLLPSLASNSNFIFSRFSVDGTPTTTQTLSVLLQHQLYQSLRTNVGLRGALADFPKGGGQQTYGGQFNTQYQRRIRGGNRLVASYSRSFDRNNHRSQGNEFLVFQERHAPRFGAPLRLSRFGVIPGSITLSGESGILFLEGLDYAVRFLGNFAEIEILPGSRIREGETLLADYRTVASAAVRFASHSTQLTVGAELGWMNPFYTFETTRQDFLSGSPEGFLNEDLTAHSVGLQLRWTRPQFQMTLSNEYHDQDSRLIPYKSLRMSQSLLYTPRYSLSFGFSFNEDLSRYQSPLRETASGSGRVNIGWVPWPSLSVEAFLGTRLWRDTIAIDENYREAGTRVRWSSGRIEMDLSFHRNVGERNKNRWRDSRVAVSFYRRF